MPRLTLALALLGALALAAWAVAIEPRRLVVRRRALRPARWPRELDGLRLVLVADLHAGAPGVDVERVARAAQAEGGDLVALLGDFVDPEVRGGEAVAPEAVAAPLGALRAPLGVVAVLGNHDWDAGGLRVAGALRDAGITVLENDAVPVPAAAPLWVAGVADLRYRRPDVGAALRRVPDEAAVLLLSHDPDVFPAVPERVALTVSGHLHGGQVNLPLLRRPFVPSHYGERYLAGEVREDGRTLYVSSGVGTSGWPLRLGRPPEIVVLELRAAVVTSAPAPAAPRAAG